MTAHPLLVRLSGSDALAMAEVVVRWPFYDCDPAQLDIDDEQQPDSRDWQRRMMATTTRSCADWDTSSSSADTRIVTVGLPTSIRTTGRVLAAAPAAFERAEDFIELIAGIAFELCSCRTVWPREWDAIAPEEFGFGQGHEAHGWACAFRGAGHDRLVSRRWLDYGPWRLVRADGDLTLVQFHDLDVDAATALAQATPGHARMGISATGGFIQRGKPWYPLPDGLYDRATRTLEYVVAGRELPEPEMLAACTLRRLRKHDPAQPIDRVAYVFLTDAEARAHLHALWLRELECWSVENGVKRRLDLDYRPPPP